MATSSEVDFRIGGCRSRLSSVRRRSAASQQYSAGFIINTSGFKVLTRHNCVQSELAIENEAFEVSPSSTA
jgi:hypothetical protein